MNTSELIIKAIENNLPMNDLRELKGHSKNILKQTYELIVKFEPIINELTDNSVNIPCVLSKLNEKMMCHNNNTSVCCKLIKSNKNLVCKPINVVKRNLEPLFKNNQDGGYKNKRKKSINNTRNKY